MEPSFAIFLLILIVGAMVLARRRRKPDTNHLYVSGTPAKILKVVIQRMVQNGFNVAYRDDTMATFTRPKKPDLDIAVLLLILGIVPGLLYLGLYKGTATTTVMPVDDNGVTRLVLSGDDYNAQWDIARWANSA